MIDRLRFVWLGLALCLASASMFAQTPNLWTIGQFEGAAPSFWTVGSQPSGSTVTWATDQFRSLGHSLKITKSATSDSAAWISQN
ncbi:MAG TPA: hypothetical protein VJB38_11165, partial [Bacteroidota bacterium]|nr:hypothetical protein [Bacteroidota bacterium]